MYVFEKLTRYLVLIGAVMLSLSESPLAEPKHCVRISEVAWAGSFENTNDEWITLRNLCDRYIRLDGWTLFDRLEGCIPPFGHYLLEREHDDVVLGLRANHLFYEPLSNEGESIQLRNANGELVDEILHGWYNGSNQDKSTMARVDFEAPGTAPEAWGDGVSLGTPQNSAWDGECFDIGLSGCLMGPLSNLKAVVVVDELAPGDEVYFFAGVAKENRVPDLSGELSDVDLGAAVASTIVNEDGVAVVTIELFPNQIDSGDSVQALVVTSQGDLWVSRKADGPKIWPAEEPLTREILLERWLAALLEMEQQVPQSQDRCGHRGGRRPLLSGGMLVSRYSEGSGDDKVIEIMNRGFTRVLLSDYGIARYANGRTVPDIFWMSGTLAPGETHVVANPDARLDYQPDECDPTAIVFNGDDAVALVRRTDSGFEVVDLIGEIGVDPGVRWTGVGWSTKDDAIVRRPSVCSGNPDGFMFDGECEWNGTEPDGECEAGACEIICR